ncbi:GAF domain-containing protein [Chloroflexota bacterium]
MEKIKRFLSVPILDDEEKYLASTILNILLLSFVLIFSVGLTIMVLFDSMRPLQISLLLLGILIMFILRIPLKRGYVKEVSWTLFVLLTLIIPMVLAIGGTVRLPAISLFVLVSVIAGLTLGKNAAIMSAIINIIIVSTLIWAEFYGYLPPFGEISIIQQILMFAISTILTVMLINQTLTNVHNSLKIAKENQIKLTNLNQDLEQRVATRTLALETSNEVSRQISTMLDQQRLVRDVTQQLRTTFGYYHVHIYLFDESKQNLVMEGGTGDAGRAMMARGHMLKRDQGLVGRAAQQNQLVLIPDVSKAKGWLPNPLLPETKSELAVPIAIGSEVLGVLDIQHHMFNGLGDQDAKLVQSIANQVAIAIQNAQTFTRSQEKAVQEAQVSAINQRIQSAMTIEDVLQIAISELGQALRANQSRIELFNPNLQQNLD